MADPPQTPVTTAGGASESVAETPPAVPPGQKDTRLIITKLVLDNFKSYYGEVVIGPLHKCFSSIVGPNGSGKSNVIDALLFVFGYRAKQMRQSKVSELIHNSKIHKNLDTAKVSVHFMYIKDKDGEDYEPVEGSELVVTRTAHRNNSSKYYVNGKVSTHTEVTDMLKDTGIELGNNRFMILQGAVIDMKNVLQGLVLELDCEVEGIALKGPKAQGPHDQGLLEYIEDIIGSDRFVDLIQQTSEKVGTLGEERTEKLQRVKVVEKEMGNLEGAKTEAEKFIKLQNQLDLAQGTLYQVHAALANREAEAVEQEQSTLAAQCKELTDALKAQQDKLAAMEQQFAEKQKDVDAVTKAMQKSKSEFAIFEHKDVKHREEIAFQRKTAKSLEAKIKKDTRDLASTEVDLEKHIASIPKAEAAVKTLVEKHAAEEAILEGIFQEIREETAHFQADIEKLQIELEPYATEVNTCTGTRDELQNELDLLSTRVEEGQKALEETESSLNSSSKLLTDRTALVKDLNVKREHAQQKLDGMNEELGGLKESIPAGELELRAARSKAEELKTEKDQVKTHGAVLEGLLAQKNKGSIPGIRGRLGDLGAIDSQYDVAISTACPALNNIVVDSRDTGQRCVEFLKEQQLGRATFLMLDGVSSLKVTKGPFPDNVPRLYDLVKVADESVKPAFYFALRDTLVAKDLDQATRIAYGDPSKRYRVVTLDGQMIESTGAMSGGGKKVAKGGMRATLTYIAEEAEGAGGSVEDAENEVKRLVKATHALVARQKQLVPAIAQLKKQIKLWDTQIRKADVDIESLKLQIEEANAALPDLRENATVSATDQALLKDLQKRVKQANTQLASAEKKAKTIQVKIEALKEKVLETGGVRLRAQKFKVESLQKDIDKKEEGLTKAQVQVKSCQKTIKKATDRKAKAEADLATLKTEMEQTKAEFRQVEEDALKVMQAFQKTEALLANRTEELEDIRKEYEALKKSIATQRAKDVDLTNKLDDLTRTIKDAKSRASQWKRKLSNIRRRAEAKTRATTRTTRQTEEPAEGAGSASTAPTPAAESTDATEDAPTEKHVLKDLEGDELDAAVNNQAALEVDIASIEQQIGEMNPNMGAIQEYATKEMEYTTRVADLDEVTARRDAARQEHDSLRKRRLDEFMAGFSVITMKLKEMYQMITLGGDAELELVDSLDPFSEGIVFSVRPPKKSWKNISNLSGGEKTLASLALVFALHHYKPTPLYVMDEIDAALDFRNVSIVANYIKERTKNAQFIIISLRNNMFELGDRLVGIYKTQDCTKSITINPHAVAVPDPATASPE